MGYLTLTLSFIYFIWVLLFLPIILSPKVYSPYHQLDAERNNQIEKEKNFMRKIGAIEYLKKLDKTKSKEYYHDLLQTGGHIDHLFIVIAGEQINFTYVLTQLVTKLDREFHLCEHCNNAMIICNARANPKDEEIEKLSKYFFILKPNLTEEKYIWSNEQQSQKTTFVRCVKAGLEQFTPNYVTVMLDSVIPYDKFLHNLNFIVKNKIESHIVRGERQNRTREWVFLHLHEPVHTRGFDLTSSSFQEIFLLASAGGILFYLLSDYLNKGIRFTSPPSQKNIFSIFGVAVFVTFTISCGRPYLSEVRWCIPDLLEAREIFQSIPVTCVTLPYDGILKMLKYLKGINCSPYATFQDVWDHALGTFETPGYVVSPSFVKFIHF